jgi:hypothetical protein
MATSGTQTWELDISEIIIEASGMAGGPPESGYDAESARRSLNMLFADLTNRGVPLWKLVQYTQALVDGTSSYTLPAAVVDVLQAVTRRSNVDVACKRISFQEYLNISTKATEGRPNQFCTARGKDTATLYLWPTPENSTDTFVYWGIKRMDDAGASKFTADVPYRFIPAIVHGLAFFMAKKNKNFPLDRLTMLKNEYEELLATAREEDRDRAGYVVKLGNGSGRR